MKIILSGGGTGGHLFPAIAIANKLKEKEPKSQILFVGAKGKMEMTKVPQNGYKIKGLWIDGMYRGKLFRNLLLPLKIISSIIKSFFIIKKFKPNVVVGTGGYASMAVLYVASLLKIPTLIQEQNFIPGLTNRFLAKKVDKICVVDEKIKKYFPSKKVIITGNPVRDVIARKVEKTRAAEYFGVDLNKKTVLIIGGSLGARTINEGLLFGIMNLLDDNIQILWQTGKLYLKEIQEKVKHIKNKSLIIKPFINKMEFAYALADLVVSRAGAISISEIAITKKPAIFVPSPNVAEDHQTKNAMALVNKNAAYMIEDKDAIEILDAEIIRTINNEKTLLELSQNIAKIAKYNATDLITNEIKNICN